MGNCSYTGVNICDIIIYMYTDFANEGFNLKRRADENVHISANRLIEEVIIDDQSMVHAGERQLYTGDKPT